MAFGEGGLKGFLARATMQPATLEKRGYKKKSVNAATGDEDWETPSGKYVTGDDARTMSVTTPENVHGTRNDPKKVFPKDENSAPDMGAMRSRGRKIAGGD